MALPRPRFVALYLLGAEVFAFKWGSVEEEPEPRGVDGGGATGSHELGFVMDADAVVARNPIRRPGPRPC